jgi:hypothetical protein
MKRRPAKSLVVAVAICGGWGLALAMAAWSGRTTPLDAAPPEAPRWVTVNVPPSGPAARDWTHFLACSGLAGDPELMRATLLLNGGGDPAVWSRTSRREALVRVALVPTAGTLSPEAEKIISDAPGAVADCGDAP